MPQNTEHKLIESIYGVTIDLDKYSDLLLLWEDEFLRPDAIQNDAPNVETHVQNAATILEMTQPLNEQLQTLAQVVDARALPTLLLSEDKRIFLANKAAQDFLI